MSLSDDKKALPDMLLDACIGHPNAKIPWPHRLLHEASDRIKELEQQLEECQKQKESILQTSLEIQRLQQQVKERGQIGLYEKIVNRIIERYKMYPVQVANACDEEIDTSGNLLGWIREAAMNEDGAVK